MESLRPQSGCGPPADLMQRVRAPELMDRPEADRAQLWKSLEDLAVVNLLLGGRSTAVRLVLDLASKVSHRPVKILDVGTGGADIPRRLVVQARKRGVAVSITASDIHPVTLQFARAATARIPEIAVQAADALHLPFGDGSYDIVTSYTTLHHFDRSEAAKVLSEMVRVARTAVVVTDLSRSAAALAGANLLAATLWRYHPITRHDGPISVRAAFTPEELLQLAREVTSGDAIVRRHPLFRLSLVIAKGGAAA